ncbi:MAG: DNA-binding domain-containing protein [Bacteroidota bacterium]|nr:DNA-binding domain-containing protein [Bacteroidota bacterium]
MSVVSKSFWKIWLKPNLLTKDVDNDYIAEVSTGNVTKRNEDIARRIVELGSEIKYETLLSVLNQSDRVVREYVQQGESVLTGNCQFTPRVSGVWIGANAKFDSSAHKIGLDITPSAEMRNTFTEIGVEVLGVKNNVAYIGLVVDTATGNIDGSITAGDDIRIEGDRIRVAPEGEEGLGIFFVNSEGVATPVTRRLTQNDPKTILARVPELPAGQYTLRVVTKYSTNAVQLKEARTIEYERLLTIS